MAFQIHQDFRKRGRNNIIKNVTFEQNLQKPISKIPIIKEISLKGDKNCVLEKKSFLDNREVLRQKENNVLNKSKIKTEDPSEFNSKEEKHVKDLLPTLVEEPFLPIEKENRLIDDDPKKESFPLSLLYNVEYREEIRAYLSKLEKTVPLPNPSYMKKQTEINWESRSILVDWLANVSENFSFCHESFHLGVGYIDRFLEKICVARNKFQLVGAAAMMLATKMEEYYPIDAKEWASLTENTFSSKQVLLMEQVILKVLKFRMQVPTINNYIQMFSTEHKMDDTTMNLAMYISELVLLEGNDYLNLLPSKLAAACVALARYTLWKRITWPKRLKKVSGYSLKDL
ncbi:unnamed protein product, partial [Psylliodes chrysocephalus]